MDKEKIDKYYNHYKDTCSLNKEAQISRDKGFVHLCILEALSFMLIWNPSFICGLLNDLARKELESTIQFGNSIVQTLVWILIAYCLVHYVQDVLYVERQYEYLNLLENKISRLLGESQEDGIFNREGERYLKDYPMVLNFIDLFYKFFFPILFTVINIFHIVQEWNVEKPSMALVVDTAICVAVFIISWFYFFEIHDKITSWFKKCPPIRWAAKMLRRFLKEV